ncbi:beta-N-acetylhexosaminidase [Nitrosovibrio sp. Nv17]|jgi:beta-N-acetylhexosaminidase|uniref:beta-N-acetylhexosaminidase n=1 Tax=Nitrosovibrio sp. Nv17 TaxID=1855339 RepID=UPI0009087F3A|nr:beta-N-acetylhexosaminidase [Nitrosovibrio sp. Nv17]SFW13264.1 beta-N-acetylhexosaminidase [Nitrosovibrio sp. Nv17]
MSLGPVMLDIEGVRLTANDRKRLLHPLVGGTILFARNYASPEQLMQLTADIHDLRTPPLLIAVDHEGGRVQRFRDGFTRLPPMRALGMAWDTHHGRAKRLAKQTGYVLAAELRAAGVDFSFTPVLDVDHGQSCVIEDRAFHRTPQGIVELAQGLMAGLRLGGMAAVGKHFPGHGYIRADSHVEMPVDERSYADIRQDDLIPFSRMIHLGLTGIMPAHVLYPHVDAQPAGFSRVWLKDILRGELGFEGCIFSDDLDMAGAGVAGGILQRAQHALQAGCDMILVCNNPEAADTLLAELQWDMPALSVVRLARMRGRHHPDSFATLRARPAYVDAVESVAGIGSGRDELPLA